MDRFKFRVWLIKKNKYLKTGFVITNNGNVLVKDIIFDGGFSYKKLNKKDYILEQCTGLKDKNGVLIYEGDILFYNIDKYKVLYFKGRLTPVKITLSIIRDVGFVWDEVINEHFEIIGNIHKDKHLLKGE